VAPVSLISLVEARHLAPAGHAERRQGRQAEHVAVKLQHFRPIDREPAEHVHGRRRHKRGERNLFRVVMLMVLGRSLGGPGHSRRQSRQHQRVTQSQRRDARFHE
jgi:hypothetical protein